MLTYSYGGIKLSIKVDLSTNPLYILILSHGAGAGMDHPFIENVARLTSERNGTVIRFNFPYMEEGRRSPGPPKKNIESFHTVFKYVSDSFSGLPVFLCGKSYGGRMASHWVLNQQKNISGMVYLGFPLHMAGKPSKERADHLSEIFLPQLFIQGTNDALANYSMIKEVVESCQKGSIHPLEHANHSFKIPKKASDGTSESEIIDSICDHMNHWALLQIN